MYLGPDYGFGSTVFFTFTTVNSSGVPTAFSSGGITVYRNASTVQDTTGITLTSSHDTRTGFNHVQIDMSTAGFYSSAGSYTAIISSGAASEDLSGYTLAQWTLARLTPFSTAGLETLSSVGLETLSSAGLETLSTLGITTLSSAGLETLSSAGLETLSSVGLETLSSAGLETISSAVVRASASSALENAKLDHLLSIVGSSDDVADGSLWSALVSTSTSYVDYDSSIDSLAGIRGALAVSTDVNVVEWGGSTVIGTAGGPSTAGLETLSSVGLETLSSVGLETLSSVGLETLSTAGLETASSNVNVTELAGVAAPASVLSNWLNQGVNRTADSGSTVTLVDAANTEGEDFWLGALLAFRSGTNDGRIAIVSSFAAGTDTLRFAPETTAAVTTEDYTLVPGLGLTLLSSAGLETLSTAGLETVSTVGLETLSTIGIETLSTAGLETLSTVGLETLSTVGIETLSSVGLETVSTVGLETASSLVDMVNMTTAAALQVNAEVLDVVNTDAFTVPLDLPTTAESIVGMLGFQHASLTQQLKTGASHKTFHNPAGGVQWLKPTIDDGTTYVELRGTTST